LKAHGLLPALLTAFRWLCRVLWIYRPAPIDLSDKALRDLLWAPVRLTLDEWLALDEGCREDFSKAYTATFVEQALARSASSTAEGALALSRMVDGGEAAEEVTLQNALSGALTRRFGRNGR